MASLLNLYHDFIARRLKEIPEHIRVDDNDWQVLDTYYKNNKDAFLSFINHTLITTSTSNYDRHLRELQDIVITILRNTSAIYHKGGYPSIKRCICKHSDFTLSHFMTYHSDICMKMPNLAFDYMIMMASDTQLAI